MCEGSAAWNSGLELANQSCTCSWHDRVPGGGITSTQHPRWVEDCADCTGGELWPGAGGVCCGVDCAEAGGCDCAVTGGDEAAELPVGGAPCRPNPEFRKSLMMTTFQDKSTSLVTSLAQSRRTSQPSALQRLIGSQSKHTVQDIDSLSLQI